MFDYHAPERTFVVVSTQHASDVAIELAALKEFERNAACWAGQSDEVSRRLRGKWILIYDGEMIHIFDDPAGMFAALEALPEPQRRGAYHHFIRRRPTLPFSASFLRPRRP